MNWRKSTEKPITTMRDDYNKNLTERDSYKFAESEPLFVHLNRPTQLLLAGKECNYEVLVYLESYDIITGELVEEGEWQDSYGTIYDKDDIIEWVPVSEVK